MIFRKFLSDIKRQRCVEAKQINNVNNHASMHPYFYASKKAFTLAEVLITLGIIGVVASITMPALIQKQNEKETVSRLKKAYSALSQAYLSTTEENDTPDNWNLVGLDELQGAKNVGDLFSKYIKIIKKCTVTNRKECGMSDTIYSINGRINPYNSLDISYYLLGADGISYMFITRSSDCSQVRGNLKQLKEVCGIITVDINGLKKPNKEGIDIFDFYLTKYGIYPAGTQYDTVETFNSGDFSCSGEDANNGTGCTAWVLYNENMDYLHCNDLSWDSKTKCK